MFGHEYSDNLEILMESFGQMSDRYKKSPTGSETPILKFLQKIYIKLLGVPEIGFQLRNLYFKKILKKINANTARKILDAGSGIGAYSFWLSNHFPSSRVEGWEIDKFKLSFSRELAKKMKLQNVKFFYKDIAKYKKINNYDLIINIDVLEHIKDYRGTIKNFSRYLKKGGYLYIHTPQVNQKRYLKSLKSWKHEDHAREGFEPQKLMQELKDNGFKIISFTNTFGFFGSIAWELNHLILLKRSFIILGLAYPFLYVLSIFDLLFKNRKGLGIAVLAKKN